MTVSECLLNYTTELVPPVQHNSVLSTLIRELFRGLQETIGLEQKKTRAHHHHYCRVVVYLTSNTESVREDGDEYFRG